MTIFGNIYTAKFHNINNRVSQFCRSSNIRFIFTRRMENGEM